MTLGEECMSNIEKYKKYFTKEYLSSIDKEVRRTRDIKAPNPSIATLLWSTIVIMDSHIKEWYFDKKVKYFLS